MALPTLDAARDWLAGADTTPEHAHRWWSSGTVALLPLGVQFDAIEIPAATAEAVAGAPEIDGPVIRYAETGRLYVLVPAGTYATWDGRHVLCLGDGHYLGIPDPDRTDPPGAHWVRPPDGSGRLTSAITVQQAVARVIA